MSRERRSLTHKVALGLMAAAIVFWLWFGIGSAASEHLGAINWVLHILLPAGLFIIGTLVAWRWTIIGGLLLVAEGLLGTAFVTFNFRRGGTISPALVPMLLSLALPPLCAGILFLVGPRQKVREEY